MENRKHILIIGGGIFGISALHFARKQGYSVQLLESATELGGRIQTRTIQDTHFELGPNTVMYAGKSMEELLHDFHLSEDIVYASKNANKRLVKKKNNVYPIPSNPIQLLRSNLLSGSEKWRLIKNLYSKHTKPTPQSSLLEWVEGNFGSTFAHYIVDAFVKGVYAEDAANLNLQATFPELYTALQQCKSPKAALRQFGKSRPKSKGIITLKKGWKSIFQKAIELYPSEIQTNVQISSVNQLKNGIWEILCLQNEEATVYQASHLIISPKQIDLTQIQFPFELPQIPYTSLRVSHYTYPIRLEIPDAYGILFPEIEKKHVYGILFNDKIFPKVHNRVMTVFSPFQYTQEEVKQEILKCFPGFSGIELKIHTIWENSIPKPTEEVVVARNKMLAFEQEFTGLHFGNDVMGHIAVGQRIEFAKQIVDQCK